MPCTWAWDPAKGRVRLRTFDPGFYFPVLDEDADPGDYPQRVHLAWEIPENTERGAKARVRRITYELGPITAATRSSHPQDDPSGRGPGEGVGGWLLEPGDVVREGNSVIERVYPWAPDRPSSTTCFLTDAEWFIDDLRHGQSLDDLPLARARFRTRSDGEVLNRLDLRIDFIPLVHVSNTVADGEHFGQSSLAPVMQVLESSRRPTRTRRGPQRPRARRSSVSRARVPKSTVSQDGPARCRWRPVRSSNSPTVGGWTSSTPPVSWQSCAPVSRRSGNGQRSTLASPR